MVDTIQEREHWVDCTYLDLINNLTQSIWNVPMEKENLGWAWEAVEMDEKLPCGKTTESSYEQ